MRKIICHFLIASLLILPQLAFAKFPDKPVHVVFPNSAGGTYYTIALAISNKMSQGMPTSISVQPMPGAATSAGTRYVAQQPADGYTLEFIHEGVLQASLLGMLGFKVLDKLQPLASVVTQHPALYVRKDAPFNDLHGLVKYVKAHPGQMKLAINTGSSAHVQMLAMAQSLGIAKQVNLVNTVGGGHGFVQALLTKDVGLIQANPTLMKDLVTSGKVKAIAYTGAHRAKDLPNVPTMDEQGYKTPSCVENTAYFWIRRDAPEQVKNYWRNRLKQTLTDPKTKADLESKLGLQIDYETGPKMMKALKESYRQRRHYLKELGLLGQ